MKKLSLMSAVGVSLFSLVRIDAHAASQINSDLEAGVKQATAHFDGLDIRIKKAIAYAHVYKKMLDMARESLKDVAQIRASDDGAHIYLHVPLRAAGELPRTIEPKKDDRGAYLVIPFNSGVIEVRENRFNIQRRQQIGHDELETIKKEVGLENDYENGSAKRMAAAVSYGAWIGLPPVDPSTARIKRDTDSVQVTLPLKYPSISIEDVRVQDNNAESVK
jgi:hypothetical protein